MNAACPLDGVLANDGYCAPERGRCHWYGGTLVRLSDIACMTPQRVHGEACLLAGCWQTIDAACLLAGCWRLMNAACPLDGVLANDGRCGHGGTVVRRWHGGTLVRRWHSGTLVRMPDTWAVVDQKGSVTEVWFQWGQRRSCGQPGRTWEGLTTTYEAFAANLAGPAWQDVGCCFERRIPPERVCYKTYFQLMRTTYEWQA